MRKILISSTQPIYVGGASTNSYALIKLLRKYGYKVAGLFFINSPNKCDPDNIGGIFTIVNGNNSDSVKLEVEKFLGGSPEIILAKNYAAPVQSRQIWGGTAEVAYLVSGSPQMMSLSNKNISAVKYLTASMPPEIHKPEQQAVKVSNYIIPNSTITRKMLIKNYPKIRGLVNPINTSLALNISNSKVMKWDQRKYDIAFICSNFSRTVKNSKLAFNIFSNPDFSAHNKLAIGDNSQRFGEINNTKQIDLLAHDKIINILGNTKLVICTSYFDASPNIIQEALSQGCNILVSKNCGWSEIYPSEFVCGDVYSLKEWVVKIKKSLEQEITFEQPFSEEQIIKDLKEIIK
jgi:glycosyltransferase involved in cell wall biosynthesis